MELLVFIIAVGVMVLVLALIKSIHDVLIRFNIKLWLSMNYPGALRKNWPGDAYNLVYTPKAVAMGIHPLLFIVSGILAVGIFFISSSGAEGRGFLQSAGEVMIAIPIIVFMIYVSVPLFKILKQSLMQGTAQDVDTNLQEPLEMIGILKARISRGGAGEMLPLYRLWHAFFVHDMLSGRMEYLRNSTAARARGVIPSKAAEQINDEIRQVSEVYESSFESEKVPAKVKRETRRRNKQLKNFLRYKIAEEEKIIFACPKCEQKLSVSEDYAGTQQNCPSCGEELAVPREDKILNRLNRLKKRKQTVLIFLIASALAVIIGQNDHEASWGRTMAVTGAVGALISFIWLITTSISIALWEREKE